MLAMIALALFPAVPVATQIDHRPVEVWDVRDIATHSPQTSAQPSLRRPSVITHSSPDGAADGISEPWLSLADCESGDWIDRGAAFVPRSARWDWAAPGTTLPPWGTSIHHGGLQFHPDTWTWVAPDVLPDPPAHAYDATPAEQVAVAIETQRRQGWGAWPVCSRLLGLR